MLDIAWTIVVICWTFIVIILSITKIQAHRCGGGIYDMQKNPLAVKEKWLMRALIFIYVFFTFWITYFIDIPLFSSMGDVSKNYFIKLGLAIFIIAMILYSRARVAITSNWVWDKECNINMNKLIKADIYNKVRHPQYTAYFLAVLATGIMLLKIGIVLFAIILIPLIYFKTKAEEEILIEIFPEEYPKYIKETGMFF